MKIRNTAAVTAVAALLALGTTASPATAAEDAEGLVTWSVAPADESGRDGRSWVERDVEPGESIQEHAAVTNFGDTAVTFGLSAADGYFTDGGRFTMLPASEKSVAAGTWVDIPESLTVGPGATVVTPFTITVPDNATPGDNAAGVAASIFSPGSGESGAHMGLESRVGFRVMLRVAGELSPSFGLDATATGYDLSWNPLRPGSVTVGYDLVNEGNTRLLLSDSTTASGRFEEGNAAESPAMELLPGDVRRVERTVEGVWPLGLISLTVAADGVVAPGGAAAGVVQRQIWVWAMPWPHLLILAGAALVVGALIWRRRRSAAELERRLEDVRRKTEQAVRAELQSSETRA